VGVLRKVHRPGHFGPEQRLPRPGGLAFQHLRGDSLAAEQVQLLQKRPVLHGVEEHGERTRPPPPELRCPRCQPLVQFGAAPLQAHQHGDRAADVGLGAGAPKLPQPLPKGGVRPEGHVQGTLWVQDPPQAAAEGAGFGQGHAVGRHHPARVCPRRARPRPVPLQDQHAQARLRQRAGAAQPYGAGPDHDRVRFRQRHRYAPLTV